MGRHDVGGTIDCSRRQKLLAGSRRLDGRDSLGADTETDCRGYRSVTTRREPLAETAASLREGRLGVDEYVEVLCDRIAGTDDEVHAWLDGTVSPDRVLAEARALAERYPDADRRPPLYGVPVGIKDVFHVTPYPTRANADLPPGELVGPEGPVVRTLREAGALVLGKTVTAEFAYFEPGPTRNPHDHRHTPGGSSSGSAAAVAAGTCPLAIGTQTIGSVIRPAAFCGVVGFKPTYGRIPLEGAIPAAPSVDHVGLFTQDVAGMGLAAGTCLEDWDETTVADRPVLGVPEGPYLEQASDAGLRAFGEAVDALETAGYAVRRVDPFDDVDGINERHEALVAAEMAQTHHEWFEAYADRYADATAEQIRTGRSVSVETLADARSGRSRLRGTLAETAADHGIDVWVSPAAPGPAPEGIDSTGDPVMNLPWTHAGAPAVSVPTGTVDGLPVGLQCVGKRGEDESLLARSERIAAAFDWRS